MKVRRCDCCQRVEQHGDARFIRAGIAQLREHRTDGITKKKIEFTGRRYKKYRSDLCSCCETTILAAIEEAWRSREDSELEDRE